MRENSVEEDPSSPRRGPEQVVNLLREVEVEVANGKTPLQACRDAGIHTQTYYRWRKGFGGLKLDPAKLSWFSLKWRVAVFDKLLSSAAARRGFSRHRGLSFDEVPEPHGAAGA